MRIIKEGSRPETALYESTCWNCQTVFEYVRSEAKLNFDQRDGDFLSIDCPLCKSKVTHAVRSTKYEQGK